MFLLMDVYIYLINPATLLAVVDGRLKLILHKRRHIIHDARSEEVSEQVLVSSTTVSGFLCWSHVGPGILLASSRQ